MENFIFCAVFGHSLQKREWSGNHTFLLLNFHRKLRFKKVQPHYQNRSTKKQDCRIRNSNKLFYSLFEKYGCRGRLSHNGGLYDAWLDTLDKSILDENFELLFDERAKQIHTLRLNKVQQCLFQVYLAISNYCTTQFYVMCYVSPASLPYFTHLSGDKFFLLGLLFPTFLCSGGEQQNQGRESSFGMHTSITFGFLI